MSSRSAGITCCASPTSSPPDARPRAIQDCARDSKTPCYGSIRVNGAFASFSIVYGSGARSPTAAQTAAITNHGQTVYVTPRQKFVVDTLRRLMFAGIISAMLGALIIDRMLGVPLFSNSRR